MNNQRPATVELHPSEVYRDYPTTRLAIGGITTNADGALVLPDGPWTKNNTNLPTPEESTAFQAAGYDVDSQGRPLHPWLLDILEKPNAGVVTGKGFYHNWGPNFTADPIVLTNDDRPSVLLVKRGDNGFWALPGGFVDPDETNPLDAARRELFEETNLKLDQDGMLVYQDAVADARTLRMHGPRHLRIHSLLIPVNQLKSLIRMKYARCSGFIQTNSRSRCMDRTKC